MSEDMTYDAEPTRADLRTRVAELERENAELRAKVDAVPVAVIKLWFERHWGSWERYWPEWAAPIGVWLRDAGELVTHA